MEQCVLLFKCRSNVRRKPGIGPSSRPSVLDPRWARTSCMAVYGDCLGNAGDAIRSHGWPANGNVLATTEHTDVGICNHNCGLVWRLVVGLLYEFLTYCRWKRLLECRIRTVMWHPVSQNVRSSNLNEYSFASATQAYILYSYIKNIRYHIYVIYHIHVYDVSVELFWTFCAQMCR